VHTVNGLSAGVYGIIAKVAGGLLKDKGNVASDFHSLGTVEAVSVNAALQTHVNFVEVGPQVLSLTDNLIPCPF